MILIIKRKKYYYSVISRKIAIRLILQARGENGLFARPRSYAAGRQVTAHNLHKLLRRIARLRAIICARIRTPFRLHQPFPGNSGITLPAYIVKLLYNSGEFCCRIYLLPRSLVGCISILSSGIFSVTLVTVNFYTRNSKIFEISNYSISRQCRYHEVSCGYCYYYFFFWSSKRSEWNAIEKRSPRTDERNEKQLLWNDRRNEISTSFTLVRPFGGT